MLDFHLHVQLVGDGIEPERADSKRVVVVGEDPVADLGEGARGGAHVGSAVLTHGGVSWLLVLGNVYLGGGRKGHVRGSWS